MSLYFYRKCTTCGKTEKFESNHVDPKQIAEICDECYPNCTHKDALKHFETCVQQRALNIDYIDSGLSKKPRSNVFIKSIAKNGTIRLMVKLYCNSCKRWRTVPFYALSTFPNARISHY